MRFYTQTLDRKENIMKHKKLCLLLSSILALSFTACHIVNNADDNSDESFSGSESVLPAPPSESSTPPDESSLPDESSNDGELSDESSSSDEEPEIDEEQVAIVDMAYTLTTGQSLDGTYTLTGVITKVNTPYSSTYKNVTVTIEVAGRESKPIMCYRLKGDGTDSLDVGYTITVTGSFQNYQGIIEFSSGCTLDSYSFGATSGGGDVTPDISSDPYESMTATQFYASYTPAESSTDAYYRSLHGFMSGELTTPAQEPKISSYQPMSGNKYVRNIDMQYEENGKAYVVVDAYGDEAFTVYKNGGYITLEEVAAYVYAFGTYPANYTTSKNTEPEDSIWGEYLRLNHTAFSGDTSRFPYEPVLPNISGCGGTLHYYEMDIGTTGTDCDPDYEAVLYNDGKTITRGAARIVYGKQDLNGNGIFETGEFYLFYTYNHYNDFQEYLNYAGGWGEKFGNITGGGTISSKYHYNPTDYVEVAWTTLPKVASTALLANVSYLDAVNFVKNVSMTA